MISTKSIVISIDDVPVTWAFEHYCNLSEKLTGQNVKIKSLFNGNDNNPSFWVYYKDGKYRWKDFSTGKGGNIVELIVNLYGLSISESISKIIGDYSAYLKVNKDGYDSSAMINQSRYKLGSVVTRKWNNLDAAYWTQFHIGSETLERFNVKPIESYTFEYDGVDKPSFTRSGNYIYGYYNFNNELYKIYQPKNTEYKFLKVRNYIQGTDQLHFKEPYLVICSSLKDAMCLSQFGYNCEVIAPDSENTIIKKEVIDLYKIKYNNICTLMDNDKAGIQSMESYQIAYDIPMVKLELEKDLSDSVRKHGLQEVRNILTPILRKTLRNELDI
jgi:hypothetical protein